MVTLDDKLVQLVSKWWTDSKIIALDAGIYSDGRLFVMAPHVGVFIRSHPFDAEKLLKARSGILTPEMIQRFIPPDGLQAGHILQPTGAIRTWGCGMVREYQDIKGAKVYIDEKLCKQLMPLKAMNVDVYVREPRADCRLAYFVDVSSAELYAVCATVRYEEVIDNG